MANGSRQAAWEFFGTELKRRREDAGLTQAEPGLRVFVSGGYIGQFEQAIRKPQLDVAQRIDGVLRSDGIFERLCRKLIDDPRYAEYFARAAEDDAPPTAYTEAVYSGNLLDDPAVVKRSRAAYDQIRAAALSPEASLTLIESAAEDYRRCAGTT
ncbi:helix-turn-helix domain-containing protein [Streptomyces griseoaurantiacus]|uniref:helix-turn-helix domain-containing protein n=1 Tax=Streptomyces griseoaurantiacus TaxID=68213 RepID=UPI002E2C3213|nr:Scr1 family TA system antitoxin-like transcriptional regulator [Streptomyces jietaisiensis]